MNIPELPLDDSGSSEGAIEALERLSRDLRRSATALTAGQARWLVDLYYTIQDNRIRSAAQFRTEEESGEPNALLSWMYRNFHTLEDDIKRALGSYAEGQEAGQWSLGIYGIGPVLAAGLLAHVYEDIKREAEPTVGDLWAFAGLDPERVWLPGHKRPWNARLKVLCYKIGESFVKTQSREGDIYGHIFINRKNWELAMNNMKAVTKIGPVTAREHHPDGTTTDFVVGNAKIKEYEPIVPGQSGAYRDQAADILRKRKFGEDTIARGWYEQGMLPPAHIHARARRYAVKLFLSHYHHVCHNIAFKKDPPKPYIIGRADPNGHIHTTFFAPPNWPRVA